jgi:hypothetical protein
MHMTQDQKTIVEYLRKPAQTIEFTTELRGRPMPATDQDFLRAMLGKPMCMPGVESQTQGLEAGSSALYL